MSAEVEERNRRLLRVRDAMDARFAESLPIEDLARLALMSPAYFQRCFRSTFGETPHRYLQRRRVERATLLLRDSRLSITDICCAVGFSSLGTFSRTFTDIIGLSPRDYRLRTPALALPNCRVMALTRPAALTVVGATPTASNRAFSEKRPLPASPTVRSTPGSLAVEGHLC